MAYVFLDTSAFIKLYHLEQGSTWLKMFIMGKHIAVSELVLIESATTLGRLYRQGIYTKRRASQIYSEIYRERSKYVIAPLGSVLQRNKVVSLAFNLPIHLRLRALDGIH